MARKKTRRGKGSPRTVLEQKASEILACGRPIQKVGNATYMVPSQSDDEKYYEVSFLEHWKCTCAYHTSGHTDCKHIIAVQFTVMNVRPVQKVENGITITMPPDIHCRDCNSIECEYLETYKRECGVSVRYKCTICKCKFTYRPGMLGRHYPDAIVNDAIDDHVNGKSLSATVQGVKNRVYAGVKKIPSRSSVWRWTEHCAKTASNTNLVKALAPLGVGGVWATDEIIAKARGHILCLFGMMDIASRFLMAYDISLTKSGYDATKLFESAIKISKKPFQVLISDKLAAFDTGFKKVTRKMKYTYGKSFVQPVHVRSASVNKKHIHNSVYERLNGTIRARIKTVRGFKSDNPPLLNLIIVNYNFLRPHESLGNKTPAEMLGISVKGERNWITLMAYAAAYG